MPRSSSPAVPRASVRRFLDEVWDVVATTRSPSAENLPVSDRLRVLPLDVTQADSTAA